MNSTAPLLSVRLLVVHVATVILAAVYMCVQAWQAELGGLGLLLISAAIVSQFAAPRFPVVTLFVFLLAAYGLPRYEHENQLLFEMGLLNVMAALGLSGWVTWYMRQTPDVHRQCWSHWALPAMLAFVGWAALSAVTAQLSDGPVSFFPLHHPAQLLQASVLLLLAASAMRSEREALGLASLLALLPVLRAVQQGSESLYLDGDIASLAVMGLPAALLMSARAASPVWLRATLALVASCLIGIIWQAQNRGAAIGLTLMLLVLLLNAAHRIRWATTLLLATMLMAAFAPKAYFQRFSVLWDPAAQHATAALDRATIESRKQLWRAAAAAIESNWWLGAGPGRETYAIGKHHEGSSKLPSHNSFVSATVETGVIGGLLFAGLILGSIVHLQWLIRRATMEWQQDLARIVQAALCGYVGISLVLSRYDMQLAYLLVGWGAALHLGANRSGEAHSSTSTRARIQ